MRAAELLWTWGIAGVIGALIYPCVPAVGPRWVFHEWPWTLPALTAARDVPFTNVPRNAMPSLHAMWTFLICYGARGVNRWLWLGLFPWATFTLLATLGGGEHYAIDLLAALPLTAAVIFCSRQLLKPISTP